MDHLSGSIKCTMAVNARLQEIVSRSVGKARS